MGETTHDILHSTSEITKMLCNCMRQVGRVVLFRSDDLLKRQLHSPWMMEQFTFQAKQNLQGLCHS